MAIRKGKYTKQSDNTSTTNTSTTNTSTNVSNNKSTTTSTTTPKKTTTTISDLVPDTKDAIDQLTKNEEEGKNIESPRLEDIQDKTNEIDTNTNEYHPRPFTSTADSIISEIDFEEGVEGSDKKANKKAVKAASKKIKKAVEDLPGSKAPYDKHAEAEKAYEEKKAAREAAIAKKEEENTKKKEEAAKAVNDFENEKGAWNRLKSGTKGAFNKIATSITSPLSTAAFKAVNAVGDTLDKMDLYADKVEAEDERNKIIDETLQEIDRISKLPEGEEKQKAIKALEESNNFSTDYEGDLAKYKAALEQYKADADIYQKAENRAMQGALYDALNSTNPTEVASAYAFLSERGIEPKGEDGYFTEEQRKELEAKRKELIEENKKQQLFTTQSAANEFLDNNEKPIAPEEPIGSPIREMVDKYTNTYGKAFDDAKEQSRLDKIKNKKNLYKGYLIWKNIMSNIYAASHNFAHPDNMISPSDPLTQRYEQDLANMIKNRDAKNNEYINEQVKYLQDTLGVNIETAKFAEMLKDSRVRNTYSRLTDENKKIVASLINAEVFDTLKPYQVLNLMDALREGKAKGFEQIAGYLMPQGLEAFKNFAKEKGIDTSKASWVTEAASKGLLDQFEKVSGGVGSGINTLWNSIVHPEPERIK